MTDNKLAETWVAKYLGLSIEELKAVPVKCLRITIESLKEAFLGGLNASRPEWHDLQKDPNDLPDNLRYVWTNVGAGYHDEDGWWDDSGSLSVSVIAWCEPKFEEEK